MRRGRKDKTPATLVVTVAGTTTEYRLPRHEAEEIVTAHRETPLMLIHQGKTLDGQAFKIFPGGQQTSMSIKGEA